MVEPLDPTDLVTPKDLATSTLDEIAAVQELLHDFADHGAIEPVPLFEFKEPR